MRLVTALFLGATLAISAAVAQRDTVFPRGVITSMSPKEGSVLGSTRITFVGEWLGDTNADTTIFLGSGDSVTPCDRIGYFSSETRLVCETESFPVRGELAVNVIVRGLQAVCNDRYGCSFRFTEDATPVVSDVSPDYVAAPGQLSFSGRDFALGDVSVENRDFDVKLGNERCAFGDNSLSSSSFQCDVSPAVTAGAHDVHVTLSQRGKARIDANVLVVPTVTSVSPLSGSVAGGQVLTIHGSGFDVVPARNDVTVHGARCGVTTVANDVLVCTTTAHAATSAAVTTTLGVALAELFAATPNGGVQSSLVGSRMYLQPTASRTVDTFGGALPFAWTDYTGVQVTSNFVAPTTGNYTFFVKGDDYVELWLSTDATPEPYEKTQQEEDDPFNEQRIAWTTRHRNGFDDESSQVSRPIALTAGSSYWMRVYVKNTGGAMDYAVRVTLPSGQNVTNPGGQYLQLRTSEPTGVKVTVNGQPSLCKGECLKGNAAFQYTAAATPAVTAVSPTTITAGAQVTIDGTGFNADGNNDITAGGIECVSLSTTATRIICAFQQVPPGTVDLKVNVRGKGFAQGGGAVTGSISVSAVSPSTGSISGGTTVTITGSGWGDVAAVVAVDIGGSACTITSITNRKILCTSTAHAAGAATLTVTRNVGATHTMSKAVRFNESLPTDMTAKARLLTTSGTVSGGTLITAVVPSQHFSKRADATVTLTAGSASVACETVFAYSSQVVCRTPYHAPGTVNVSVNGAVIGKFTFRERVSSIDYTGFGPNGGNWLRLYLDVHGTSRNATVSVGGAPCDEWHWESSDKILCYANARPVPVALPTLFTAATNVATASDLALFDHDGVTISSEGAFVIPAGKYMSTKQYFNKPISYTAHVRPTQTGSDSESNCVYMRAFPYDAAAKDSGLVGYADRSDRHMGLGLYGTRQWMREGPRAFQPGTPYENIGLNPTRWSEWKMEIRDRGVYFYIDGVLVKREDHDAVERGPVGFGHSCQTIAVKNFTVQDLTPSSIRVTIDGRTISTPRDVAYQSTWFTVSTVSASTVRGGDSFSFTLDSRPGTWGLAAHALERPTDSRPLSEKWEFCGSFSYIPDTNILTCRVSNNLPAGSYSVRLRYSDGGYTPEAFTVEVRPTIVSVSPAVLPPAGGFVTVQGRNLPMNSAGGVTFTLGSTTLSVEEYSLYGYAILQVPAVSAGSHALSATNAICSGTCNVAVAAAHEPTVTSMSPDTITDVDTAITISGTNFTGSGRIYVGTHLCTVYWSSETQQRCTLRTLPPQGSHTVTVYPGNKKASTTFSLTVTRNSARLVSTSQISPNGNIAMHFRGIFDVAFGTQTSLLSENYATAGTATTLTGATARFEECAAPIGRFLGDFGGNVRLTRALTSIATHATLTVSFTAALLDTTSNSFVVTVDGTKHTVGGEIYCPSYSLCRSSSDDCVVPVTLTVPHTAASATVTIESADNKRWGVKSISVAAGSAPTFAGSVNGSALVFESASPKTLRFRSPAIAVGSHSVALTNSGSAMPCSSCSVTATLEQAPVATAYVSSTHAATGVNWIGSDGIDQTGGSAPALHRARGSNNRWEEGATSAELFPQGGVTGVTFRFTETTSECRQMFGFAVGADRTWSYTDIDFAFYNDRRQIEVYESGSWRYGGGYFATNALLGIRCADAACSVLEYTADGIVLYRSTVAVSWPLRLDSAFYTNGCGVTDITVHRGTAATSVPVYIAGSFSSDDAEATVSISGVACPVVAAKSNMIVCNAPSAVTGTPSIYVSSPTRGAANATSVASSPFVWQISDRQGSTNGGARVQIKGAGFSSPSFSVCGNVISSTSDVVTCDTAAAAAGSRTVNATGVACAGTCPTYTYTTSEDVTLTSVMPTTIAAGSMVTVTGSNFDSSARLRLAAGVECVPTTVFSGNFTCQFATAPAAGTYNSAAVVTWRGTSASTVVTVPVAVTSTSISAVGTLGGGKLVIRGSGLSASASLTDSASAALCSAFAYANGELTCTLNAFGTVPTAPYTLTVGGQTATVALTIAASSNPTVTAVTPSSVGCGDTVVLTGTNLVNGATVTFGGIACSGVVANAAGTSATCTLDAGLTAGSSHAVAVSTAASAGTSTVTVTSRIAVCGVASTVTASGLNLVISASGIDTGAAHRVVVGSQACTITATGATGINCSVAKPAAFSGEWQDVSIATAVASTATSSFTYDANASPTVTGISPSWGSAAGGSEVTITGTKFDLNPQNNEVRIGNARCYAIWVASSQDSLRCTTEPNVVNAAAPVSVTVAGLGAASSSATFNYQLEITKAQVENNGTSVSVEGGAELTLTVGGLPATQTNVAVSIGYVNAPILSYSATSVKVRIPAAFRDHSATPAIQSVQSDYSLRSDLRGVIRLVANGITAKVNDTTQFVDYKQSFTPRVTAINIAETAQTVPESSLVVTGTGFAATGNKVLLFNQQTGNSSECSITAESATSITCTINSTLFGRARVVVYRPGRGYSYTQRTCPSGSYISCDGQCLTDADCTVSAWGRSGCNDLMELLYGETYCHSLGGSDLISRPLRLDNGKAWDFNCPLYRCEGNDCNKTLNYAGKSPRISTCGADPNGYYITLVPQITSVVGSKMSSVMGGQRFTIAGRGFKSSASVSFGVVGAKIVTVSYTSLVVETLPIGREIPNATLELTQDGTPATCAGTACDAFYFNMSTTPMVSSIGIDNSHVEQRVTINGTGFATASEVTVGGQVCVSVSQTSTMVVCNAPNLPLTSRYTYYEVAIRGIDKGFAVMPSGSSGARVRYLPRVTAITPTSGSTEGGTLVTITGFALGAKQEDTGAYIYSCSSMTIVSANVSHVIGRTAGCSARSRDARVYVHGETGVCIGGTACGFEYASSSTPSVTSHTVTSSSAGQAITMTGAFLSSTASDFSVTVGGNACTGLTASATQVTCTAPANAEAGNQQVKLLVSNHGYASGLSSAQITYSLGVTGVTPSSGSLGGGQLVTITGTGFPSANSADLYVTAAGRRCAVSTVTNAQIVCVSSPSASATTGNVFVAISNTVNATSTATYEYSTALTATVTGISPARGSTAGGTMLTITGTGLSTSHVVTISGVQCTQSAAQQSSTTASTYYCTTGAHTSELNFSTVVVSKGTDGNAIVQPGATYQYVDLWSRRTTWNGYAPPVFGESAVISEGQTIMLDYSPPRMILIVVQGHLVFDDTADITLETQYIVVHYGRFTIGTEQKPYHRRAVIRMFGDRLSPEIPLSGAKTLLVYKGRLDWHGTPRVTWSRLDQTALPGANKIVVRGDVQWNAGEEIGIAPTSFEMLEAEPRFIETSTYNSSANATTITFNGALRWQHWGVNQCWGSPQVCVDESAEVILLTRNILFTGDDTSYTNTFGATTMFRPLGQDENKTIRVSHVEFTKVGQKFMLGRYPVHFHIPGDANNSYIEGCAIHRSLQRAITIHGVNNATFRRNVVYDTFGHSIFWEDGSERHNVAEDNVVMVTRVSTSSLNSDTTPASYWLTNPMNYLRRNVACGSVFYGFWISPMVPHATGPSGGPHICPQTQSLGIFEDNRAHSNGRYGLQVKPDWNPRREQCNGNSPSEPAVLKRLTSYKNHKHGVNFKNAGPITLDGLVTADIGTNELESSHVWNEVPLGGLPNMSYGVSNGLMVAFTANQPYHRSRIRRGVNMPRTDNYFIINMTFVNFVNENWAIEPFRRQQRMKLDYPWAWEFVTEGLRFIDAPQRLRYRFEHHSIANDMDGTLAGFAGFQVVPSTPFFDNQPACQAVSVTNFNYPTYTCAPSFKIRRIGIGKSERGGNQNWTINGVNETVYRLKGGYLVSVPINQSASIEWMEAEGPNHYYTMFNSRFMQYEEHFGFHIKHRETRIAINASFDGREPAMASSPPPITARPSAWFYNRTENAVYATLRRPHDQIDVRAYRCPPEGCLTPGGPPPVNKSCSPFGQMASWSSGVVPTYDVNATYNDSICIDNSIATWPNVYMGAVTIGGRLEFKDEFCPTNGSDPVVRIYIDRWVHIKNGIFSIGNATHPVTRCRVEIIVASVDWNNRTDIDKKSLLLWGARSIALEYGTISIHGRQNNVSVAHLATTAAAGSRTLRLDRAVDWKVGDVIGIAQTSRAAMFLEGSDRTHETERANITAISADRRTLTISIALQFDHAGEAPAVLDNKTYNIGAEVALLTRRVVIHGGHWDGEQIPFDYGWQLNLGCSPQNYEGCGGGSVDENGYPMSIVRPGVVHLSGVEFRDVGVRGKRHAAIEFDGVRGNRVSENYMRGCSVHRSFAVAVSLRHTSEPVVLDSNTVFDTQGDGVRVASTDNRLHGNLVMLGRVPRSFCGSIYVPRNPDCWPALFRITAGNTLTNNSAVDAVAIGYKTEGTPCSDNVNYWRNNKAHSVRDALMSMDNPSVPDYNWPSVSFLNQCRRLEGVIAYKNADHGVAMWFTRGNDVLVRHIVSVDNAIGFAPALQSSLVDNGQQHMRLNLTDSTFAGKWPGHACTNFRFKCRKTKVDDKPWCLTLQDANPRMGNTGVWETVFMSAHTGKTLGEHYFMWSEPDGYAVVKATARYSNLFFDEWDGSNACGTKTVGIYQNPWSNDTHHQHIFSGIRYGPNVRNGGEMYTKSTYGPIPNHMTHGVPPQQTYYLDFDNQQFGANWADAPNKVWMIDHDGSLTRSGSRRDVLSSQTLTRQSTWASVGGFNGANDTGASIGPVRDGCTERPEWNMFICNSTTHRWMNLIVESTAGDAWTRRVGPVVLCKGAGMTLANGDPICENGIVDFVGGPLSKSLGHRGLQLRMSRFRFIVENGGNYTLHFRGSPPSSTRYWLTNWEHTQLSPEQVGVVVNTRIYGAFSHSRLAVYVDGRKERPTFGFGYPYEFGLTWPAPTDRAGTHYHDKYVTPALHRNVMSFSLRPNVQMDLIHEMIIQVNMDLAIPMSEFFGRKDLFAIALANALGIPEDTVRFAKIVPGTTRRQAATSTTTVGIEIDGGSSSALNTSTANAIKSRIDAAATDSSALSSALNVTVLSVVATVVVVRDPEPQLFVASGTPFVLFYVSHNTSILPGGFNTTAMQAAFIAHVKSANTNATLTGLADTSNVLIGNVYTTPDTTITRFTVLFTFAEEIYTAMAMATLNATADSTPNALMPAGYTYLNHSSFENIVFTGATPPPTVPISIPPGERGRLDAESDGGVSATVLAIAVIVPVVVIAAVALAVGLYCSRAAKPKDIDDDGDDEDLPQQQQGDSHEAAYTPSNKHGLGSPKQSPKGSPQLSPRNNTRPPTAGDDPNWVPQFNASASPNGQALVAVPSMRRASVQPDGRPRTPY